MFDGLRIIALLGTIGAALAGCVTPPTGGPAAPRDVLAGKIEGLKIETLKTARLEMVDGVEVVMSRVQIPANTTLPKHYHPGEEFIYLLEGSGTMWLTDRDDMPLAAGDVFNVPLRAVHTFSSGADGARLLVCRVHQSGKPMRYNVGEDE